VGVLFVAALTHSAIAEPLAQSADAVLKDTTDHDVGTVSFTQTPAGVLFKLSLNGMSPGVHAFQIHAVGKCEPPSFQSAGPIFNPSNTHHGIFVGPGNAGDMPNLYVPPAGALEVELVSSAITLEQDKPNSLFHPGGTAVVVYAGKDDYTIDPDGNPGARVACGKISRAPVSVHRLRAP
jgi:Cu-Zn family superoxide dismutase